MGVFFLFLSMASGSAGRPNAPGSKGFDFASDDILCSYEDYGNQDGSNGSNHSEPGIGNSSAKVFIPVFVFLFVGDDVVCWICFGV